MKNTLKLNVIVSARFHVASDIGVSCASESVSGLRHDQPEHN